MNNINKYITGSKQEDDYWICKNCKYKDTCNKSDEDCRINNFEV